MQREAVSPSENAELSNAYLNPCTLRSWEDLSSKEWEKLLPDSDHAGSIQRYPRDRFRHVEVTLF